jgi:hypothetical protein
MATKTAAESPVRKGGGECPVREYGLAQWGGLEGHVVRFFKNNPGYRRLKCFQNSGFMS